MRADLTTRVILLHDQHPTLTAPQIAERLGCNSAYVRAVAQRKGLRLPHARPGLVMTVSGQKLEDPHGV
jgi:hypothetical protein